MDGASAIPFAWNLLTVLTVVGGVAAALFAWRWWQARLRGVSLEAQLTASSDYAAALKQERDAQREQIQALGMQREAAERRADLAQQQLEQESKRRSDWEEQRKQFLELSKASVADLGSKVMNELLTSHDKKSEEASKKFIEQTQKITAAVAAIESRTAQAQGQMETVMRALTNPAGAGQMAEVGLENLLKNLGLEAGRDFLMQETAYSEDGARLRPDCIVLLPQDMVMVIDCKASKYLFEAVALENQPGEAEAWQALAATMQKHIRKLSEKDYREAVHAMLRQTGRKGSVSRVINVMYVPSERILEELKQADNALGAMLEKASIIPSSPQNLHGLLTIASLFIYDAKQAQNHQVIMEQVSKLMDALIVAFGHIDKTGKGIQAAAKGFSEFARSINGNALKKLRQLEQLGVRPGKGKGLPKALPVLEVHDATDLITLDADEAADMPLLTTTDEEAA